MNVSIAWMKQFGGQGLDTSVTDLVDRIGSQLGAVESVTDLGLKYAGAVIVKVVSCEDHPNADRLHVCRVDDGGKAPNVSRDAEGYVQVVCGAPNVHAGMLAVWLPPTVTVPSSYGKEPFVLEARDLRGVVSNGMLASPQELALGDSHEGLLELENTYTPGTLLTEALSLSDAVIDIENKMFTHRPDCFGQLGVAREVAGIYGQKFTSPDWYLHEPAMPTSIASPELQLRVINDLPELVPRFMAVALNNVHVGPSPAIIQSYLSRVGIRPINNVVDVTNYLMMLTGQPLHAYDYDKVRGNSDGAILQVRHPHEGEQLGLLNGKTITPRSEAIMIASETKLVGIGGVIGGTDTEVDATSKNIILEVATFDMYSVRRTSMAQGLFTDAVSRFNKGQSPLQNDRILAQAISMLQQNAQAQIASNIIDDKHLESTVSVHPPVVVSAAFINKRLGIDLDIESMMTLLTNVEFTVTHEADDLHITAPFWRTDIMLKEDIVEEIGRLYGYDKLPLVLPKRDITPAPKNAAIALKDVVRATLAKFGANELLTYSFVPERLFRQVSQKSEYAFQIANALSPDLQYYRLSLTPSLLEKVHANSKAGYGDFGLFEIGRVHIQGVLDEENLPKSQERLAFVCAANTKQVIATKSGAAYYRAQRYVSLLLDSLGIVSYRFEPSTAHYEDVTVESLYGPYEIGRTARIVARTKDGSELALGIVGEFKTAVTKALKLPAYTSGFEMNIAALQTVHAHQTNRYVAIPRFPKVEQDLCLKVPATVLYSQLYDVVHTALYAHVPERSVTKFDPIDIYTRPEDTDHKQITFRISLASYEKTLTDADMSALLQKISDAAASACHAVRI